MHAKSTICLVVLVLMGISGQGYAAPDVSKEADTLCRGFDETLEGVWMDSGGKELLRFKYATNADGSGCYAWLNSVSSWQIDAPGLTLMSNVTIKGDSRRWGTNQNGIHVNISTSSAEYIRDGRKTKGRLLE